MAAEDDRTTAKQPEQQAGAPADSNSNLGWLWAGLLVAPVAFLFNLQANYTLTQKLCPGGRTVLLHAVSIFFLLVAAGGGLIAWRNWERAGRTWPDEAGNRTVRNRFLSAVGLLLSVLCFLIIIAQWIPQFIFSPCLR
jgi:hypothetical protein